MYSNTYMSNLRLDGEQTDKDSVDTIKKYLSLNFTLHIHGG